MWKHVFLNNCRPKEFTTDPESKITFLAVLRPTVGTLSCMPAGCLTPGPPSIAGLSHVPHNCTEAARLRGVLVALTGGLA